MQGNSCLLPVDSMTELSFAKHRGLMYRFQIRRVVCRCIHAPEPTNDVAARVIHFGIDDCHRLSVLRRAGYDIEKCSNLIEFETALDTGADAIMVDDGDGSVPEDVISLAHTRSAAPIILFPNITREYPIQEVDLAVPSLTPPHEWLLGLANLIIRTRALIASSELLREQPARLGRESTADYEQSCRERARTRREVSRNGHIVGPNAQDRCSDPD